MKNSLAMPSRSKSSPENIKVPALNIRMSQLASTYFGQLPEMARAGQGRFTAKCSPANRIPDDCNGGEVALELDDAVEFGDLAALQDLLSEPFDAPAKAEQQAMQSAVQRGQEGASAVATSPASEIGETDSVLLGVQSTLDSLAGMAHQLSQRKLAAQKAQEALDHRYLEVQEGERRLAEQAGRLQQFEKSLQVGRESLERDAQEQAANIFQRHQAIQALEEAIERRDRDLANRVEHFGKEEQRVEQLQAHLLLRAAELDEREIAQQRLSDDLSAKYTRLVDAKNRLEIIVKSYSEKNLRLVRGAISAIEKTIPTDLGE